MTENLAVQAFFAGKKEDDDMSKAHRLLDRVIHTIEVAERHEQMPEHTAHECYDDLDAAEDHVTAAGEMDDSFGDLIDALYLRIADVTDLSNVDLASDAEDETEDLERWLFR